MRLALLAACAGTAAAMQIAITGTNSGIGRSAARILVAQGHTVYHACRSEERAREAAEAAGGGMPMVCDLADLGSVRLFALLENPHYPQQVPFYQKCPKNCLKSHNNDYFVL